MDAHDRAIEVKTAYCQMGLSSSVCSFLCKWCKQTNCFSIDRPVSFSKGESRPSWFNIWNLPPEQDEYDENCIRESVELVEQLILGEVRAGIDLSRIILVGFSQGAALALMTALSVDLRLGGVVSLSGWIPHRFRSVSTSSSASTSPQCG
jgi:predicted esterase